ncbi:hypothetical protein Mapa_016491 [Marchantia paleacea]|nr:hypothetical protein Mapa_016491 [Marchantia paleacea]
MEIPSDFDSLMVGMMELPILYNALFPVNDNSNAHVAAELVIKASENFKKQELLATHQSDMSKFTSWLDYVDSATAKKEKLRGNIKCSQGTGKGLLLRLRESVVEIPPRPPAPLGTLRPIKLSELQLDRQHYGRVLYGTFCVKAFKMTAVLTLLEEANTGRVVKLAIYNAVASTATVGEVQAQFRQGSRVAIKEPYFKRYKDQTVGLRVNNPGDVVFLESSTSAGASGDDKLRDGTEFDDKNDLDYDQLRFEGNRAFSAGDLRGAVKFYTKSIDKALSCSKSWKLETSTSGLQGAVAKIQANEKKPTSAATPGSKPDDSNGTSNSADNQKRKSPSKKSSKKRSKQRRGGCDREQSQTPMSTKADMKADLKAEAALLAAYSNRSEAWLRINKYEEAVIDAENALQIDQAHVKSMFRRGRASHCLQQYSKAIQCLQSALKLSPHDADLEKALKEAITADLQSRLGVYNLSSYYLSNFSGSPPKCADYGGPVTVQMLESKYGVGSGQRGLVTIASVKAGDLLLVSNPLAIARAEDVEFHLIPATRRMNDASQEDLVTQLYNFARVAPRALHQLQSLYNGSKNCTQPSMDLFVPGSIFNPPKSSKNSTSKLGNAPAQPDITSIRNVVQWNAFDEQGFTTGGGSGRNGLRSFCSGIWVLPSFINHSCLPNASRVHVGDAMMIYASRDLEAGEEVCLPYFDILSPLPQRREKGLAGWGFTCKCPRCKLEETLQSEIQHMTDKYSQLEEEAMPAIHQETKGGFAKKGDGFLRHTSQFLGLASEVEALLSTRKFSHLTTQKKNWVRASYAISYIVGNSSMPTFPQNADGAARLRFLSAVLDSLAEVFPGNSQTLITASMVMEEVRKQHTMKSKAYKVAEERALGICRCIYGNQKVPVLRSLMKSLKESLLEA